MSQSIDFPRNIPAPEAGAATRYTGLTREGKRALEAQGVLVASTPELTPRVVALEIAHEHAADHMTSVGLNVDNLHDEVRIVMESKQRQIDELSDRVEVLEGQLRALLKVAA